VRISQLKISIVEMIIGMCHKVARIAKFLEIIAALIEIFSHPIVPI
jgi:hypothetical protein